MERSFFFRTDDRPLYGRIYVPDGPGGGASSTRRGVLICDSLFEEKFWCERVHANMARRLAAAGNIVLSFDYYGYGNSGGDSSDLSVSSITRDISCACDLLRQEGAGAISLFGVRWGALPACTVAGERDDIDSLFLVNPVTGWRQQFMKALRANVAGQYSIFKKAVMTREKIIEELLAGGDCVRSGYRMNNLEGYYISKEFFEEVSVAAMPDALPDNVRKTWVITVPEKETDGVVPPDPLVLRWKEAGADCESLVIRDNAFWINNRIFTSLTPALFDVMEELVGSIGVP
ncbi:MAG TPA: alpha/beta hydrolase, partial [Candidatus Krumholzibacterium sp.]|nr:alpha/beta hydrolase [Candidatus Krumholzibacterium sp.]